MRAEPSGAALFLACLVEQGFPHVGDAAVLRRAGVDPAMPAAQTCCG